MPAEDIPGIKETQLGLRARPSLAVFLLFPPRLSWYGVLRCRSVQRNVRSYLFFFIKEDGL